MAYNRTVVTQSNIIQYSNAVQELANSEIDLAADKSLPMMLRAVDTLQAAPPKLEWNRGLLLGLHHPCQEVVFQTVNACIQRIHNLPDDESRGCFIELVLDYCFTRLSKQNSKSTWVQWEAAAAKLISIINDCLIKNPFAYEHQCSRLLSKARTIAQLDGYGQLARAVLEFEQKLSCDPRRGSDLTVVKKLSCLRKHRAYESPRTTESTLLAYLEKDAQTPIQEASQELFSTYRIGLNIHTVSQADRAIQKMLENLHLFLKQIPWSGPHHQTELIDDMVRRAYVGVPKDQLHILTARHLELQHEILPGPDHPEDFLKLLRKKYSAPQYKEILVRGLQVLERLPLIRFRVDELWDFLMEESRIYRDQETWEAFFRLIESVFTGLAGFVLSRNELSEKQQRRQQLMQRLLETDKRIRERLYSLAIQNQGCRMALSSELDIKVRQMAWRTLLRLLPHDRIRLYEEGILNPRLFHITLEEAGHYGQRPIWRVLHPHWHQLLCPPGTGHESKTRVLELIRFFETTRNFEAAQNDGHTMGPILSIALDNPDSEIALHASNAIIRAGYGLEIEREQQRRHLLRLQKDLTQSNSRLIELENRVDTLSLEISELGLSNAIGATKMQTLISRRGHLATMGWIKTSQYLVDLYELREQLRNSLKAANIESEKLNHLLNQIDARRSEQQAVAAEIQRLMDQQRAYEAEQQQNTQRLIHLESILEQNKHRYDTQSRELVHLQENPPQDPGDDDGSAVSNSENYENACHAHERRVSHLTQQLRILERQMDGDRTRIEACRKRIQEAAQMAARIEQETGSQQQRIKEIERNVRNSEKEGGECQARLRELRALIDRLVAETRRLESELTRESAQVQSQLDNNTQEIQALQQKIKSYGAAQKQLATQLNKMSEDRDQQTTRSQELTQAMVSGRQHYDVIGERASQESAMADMAGEANQRQIEQSILQEQEDRVQYQFGMQKALEGQAPPQTYKEREHVKIQDPERKLS